MYKVIKFFPFIRLIVPPVELRPKSTKLIRGLLYFAYSKDSAESFLFARTSFLALIVNLTLSALFFIPVITHADLQIGTIIVRYPSEAPVDQLLNQLSACIAGATLPLSLALLILTIAFQSSFFRASFLLRADRPHTHQGDSSPDQEIWRYLLMFLICSATIVFMWTIPALFREYEASLGRVYNASGQSPLLFLIVALFYIVYFQAAFSPAAYGAVHAIRACLQRYIFPTLTRKDSRDDDNQ